MKEVEAQLQRSQLSDKPSESDQQLQQRLQEAKTEAHSAITRVEQAETTAKKLEERIILAKTEINKWLDAKDNAIQWLKRQLAQQQDEARQQLAQA